MKILIVEDEPSLRELIQRSLEKERYVVETAGDFNSALYKIEDYDYDCVLLDIMLPDGSGHFWTPVGVRIHVQSGLRILAALAIAACAAVLTRKMGGHAAAIRSVQPERIPLAEKRCQQARDPRQKQDKQQNGADRQKYPEDRIVCHVVIAPFGLFTKLFGAECRSVDHAVPAGLAEIIPAVFPTPLPCFMVDPGQAEA